MTFLDVQEHIFMHILDVYPHLWVSTYIKTEQSPSYAMIFSGKATISHSLSKRVGETAGNAMKLIKGQLFVNVQQHEEQLLAANSIMTPS